MKNFYLVCGIITAISNFYLTSDTMAILGLICLATYLIMDRLPKAQEPVEETKTPPTFDMDNVSRLEVINHATNDHPIGRVLTMYETKDFRNIDMQFQDSGKTLKIFVS